jgi:hypothetical protein
LVVTIEDVVTINTQEYFGEAREVAKKKAPHTEDTWKKGRTIEEKEEDLFPGEVAELAVKKLLNDFMIPFVHYDKIRKDDFKNHDPFDFVFYNENIERGAVVKLLNDHVLSNVNKYGIIEPPFDFRSNRMLTVEVKSSKDNKGFGLENILEYQHHIGYPLPKLYRYKNQGYTLMNIPGISQDFVERYLIMNKRVKDVNIRVFFTKMDLTEAHVVGWIDKETLLTCGEIGTFSHNPRAVYHKLLLAKGKKIKELPQILRRTWQNPKRQLGISEF